MYFTFMTNEIRTCKILPRNRKEEIVFAEEGFVSRVQYEIERIMQHEGISRKQLANMMGVYPSDITRILGSDANITMKKLARILYFLGYWPELRLNCQEYLFGDPKYEQ